MSLREQGIYRLPNGRELVVRGQTSSGNELRLSGWGHFEASEYLVNDTGRILAQGKLTAWDIKKLTDTGRTTQDFGT
ncbi:MAG: hypothetical protein ACR2H6_14135 [Pyrinomonadaceae bacterium]